MIRTLFVDDELDVLEGIENRLRRLRRRWAMSFAVGAEAALHKLAAEPFDVIVSDMRMPGMDGAELLARVRDRYPHMVRIVLSGQTKHEQVLRALPVAHQMLSKPCESKVLERAVGRARGLHSRLGREEIRDLVGGVTRLASPPELYTALTEAVHRPDASPAEVAAIVERDVAMTARVLQVVNSSYFGLGREMTTAAEAVSYLGINAIRTLVLTVEMFGVFAGQSAMPAAAVEALQRHSFRAAHLAARMLDQHEESRTAFAAAMLHDIGRLVLATVHPSHGGEGAVDHADVGAALAALWGLPYSIVEGIAYHHRPDELEDDRFGVVGAVHVADRLAHEVEDDDDEEQQAHGPALCEEYLRRVGVEARLPRWRRMSREEGTQPETTPRSEP